MEHETNRAQRRSRPLPLPSNLKTPGMRHNWTLAHLCASNPRRNTERMERRAARREGIRIRRRWQVRAIIAARSAGGGA